MPRIFNVSLWMFYAVIMPVVAGTQTSLSKRLDHANQIRVSNLERSSGLADSVYKEAMLNGNDTLAMDALFLLGWNSQAAGDYASSVSFLEQLLREAPATYDREKLGVAYGRLGRNFLFTGEFTKASPLFLKFDSIINTLPAPQKNIEPKLLLGELHEHLHDHQRAGYFYGAAYERAASADDPFLKTLALYYLLDFHLIRQRQTGFGKELQEYLALTERRNADGTIHWGHAQMLFMSMPLPERLAFLERTREELKSSPWFISRYFSSSELIEAYLEQGEYTQALKIVLEELDLLRHQQNPVYKLNMLVYLTKIYESRGQYDQAFRSMRMTSALRDSLHAMDRVRFVDSLEVLHETVQKEILLTQQEEQLNKQRQQKRLTLVLFGAAIFFGAFAVLFLWNRNRLTCRLASQQRELQQQKIQQLEQENKLLAMSSMIEGQEAERKRIAQDLHDGLGGLLSSVKAQVNLVQHHVSKQESDKFCLKASTLLDTASTELRRITHNMMPSTLARLGLEAALEDLCASLRADHQIDVDLQLFGLSNKLNETTEIMLYRIVQELCNNVIKHAQATRLLVQINNVGDEVFLIVEDDGIGIDHGKSENGIGMKSIESRVRYLNGTIDIGSGSPGGTCITVQFPVYSA